MLEFKMFKNILSLFKPSNKNISCACNKINDTGYNCINIIGNDNIVKNGSKISVDEKAEMLVVEQ